MIDEVDKNTVTVGKMSSDRICMTMGVFIFSKGELSIVGISGLVRFRTVLPVFRSRQLLKNADEKHPERAIWAATALSPLPLSSRHVWSA